MEDEASGAVRLAGMENPMAAVEPDVPVGRIERAAPSVPEKMAWGNRIGSAVRQLRLLIARHPAAS